MLKVLRLITFAQDDICLIKKKLLWYRNLDGALMPTLEQIHHQINSLPHKYIFYTKKEINYLPKILAEDEEVKALTSGFMNNTTWLAVCTNRRILFLDKGMFFGLKTVQMNLDRIQSIDSSYVVFFGSLRLWDGASSFVLRMVLKDSIDPFVQTVRDQIDAYRKLMYRDITNSTQGTQQAAAPAVDIASQIERLAALKEAGHLTPAEFEKQKKKLLGA